MINSTLHVYIRYSRIANIHTLGLLGNRIGLDAGGRQAPGYR